MPTQFTSKRSLFALCAVSVTCLSALSYAAPQFQFEDMQIKDKPTTTQATRELAQEGNATDADSMASSSGARQDNALVELAETAASIHKIEKSRTKIAPDVDLSQQNTSSISNTQINEAQRAFESAQYARALQLFTEQANQGDAQAQAALGEMLWYGEGTTPNIPLAKSWFNKAANQGNAKARQFIELLTERDKRSEEIGYYTTSFDGGNLKWNDDVCPNPQLPTKNLSRKLILSAVADVNAKLDCYNNYVNMLKHNLAEMRYLPSDLKRIMRKEEIDQAAQLTREVYYKMGLQALASTDQLLAQYERWNQHWETLEIERAQRLASYMHMNKGFNEDLEHRSSITQETGVRTVVTTVNPSKQ